MRRPLAFALLVLVLPAAPTHSQATATPTSPAPADPIENTRWLGTLISPTGPAEIGLEFRRSPRGTLYALSHFPAMHIYGKPASRVEVGKDGYFLDELSAHLRLDGDTLSGTALPAGMPLRLTRVATLPTGGEPPMPAFPVGPQPRWSRALGAEAWTTPVVRDGAVYLGTADGRFHALRAADGGELWTWSGAVPLHGDALVSADALLFVDDRAGLVRLDRRSGKLSWRVQLDPARQAAATLPEDDTYSHRTPVPVLAGGVLYVGASDGSVFALDAATGRTRWRVDAGAKVCAAVAVDGERILVGTMDGTLLALARTDGRELWRQKLAGAITSAPVVAGQHAVVGGRDFLLHAFDLASGREAWRTHFWASWVESTPRLVDGVLYIGSSDLRAVRALDPATGKVLWSSDVYGSAWASPVIAADTVYIGVVGVKDYLIDHRPSIVALDRRTGAIRWRRSEAPPADAPMSGHAGAVAVADDTLFAAGIDGSLIALPLRWPAQRDRN